MATFLFDEIIFGPVKSRRLGVSLGVNLLPEDYKFCTYDCLYCECGWTMDSNKKIELHTKEIIKTTLELKLQEMLNNSEAPDNITFAGNGEPTIHPSFAEIIDDTIELRDKYFPKALISVLSNATQIHKQSVVDALNKVDQNILKLDSAIDSTYKLINQPKAPISVSKLVERLKVFKGNLIIQTMFIRGEFKGQKFDNTTDYEVESWIELLKEIKPKEVMIYPIARDTPIDSLVKISEEKLDSIGAKVRKLGIETKVYS
ncbi:MAG: radical SAM protein [Bacteroidales bacterium]|nr:radical SAM protein [Bacteroidales bacterium]